MKGKFVDQHEQSLALIDIVTKDLKKKNKPQVEKMKLLQQRRELVKIDKKSNRKTKKEKRQMALLQVAEAEKKKKEAKMVKIVHPVKTVVKKKSKK